MNNNTKNGSDSEKNINIPLYKSITLCYNYYVII